ncbi:MAG: tRNA (adenosine(37)-N6)-dimethylallyltransferase MiaA [Phycisphaerales bacterium]|nr:tRNA (adenosine(37)-N6)-dimethylallyltransferase MiaA [Phycisphaerales bacterium]
MKSTAHNRPIVLIVGPTAGGKTALSVQLSGSLPGGGECISADSMQIYTGMDIGTATPTMDERAGIPHHLLSITPPNTPYSVDDWCTAATAAIADIRGRGRWPVVVGGTNLYVQALLFGLLDGPSPDPVLRAELAALDPAELRAELECRDPEAATRIHPNDVRRTIRAVEYSRSTGRQLSAAQVQWTDACRPDVAIIGLDWPIEAINPRINARVNIMMEAGLLHEVRGLHERSMLGEQAASGVGYAQLIDYLSGRCSLDEAVEQIKIRSRRLGKQQRTWLRRFRILPHLTWINPVEQDTHLVALQSLKAE